MTSPPSPNAKEPTSHVGRENAYHCPTCGGYTVTVDVDDGVTPMFVACRASGDVGTCEGRAISSMYPAGPRPAHIPAPVWEWYRPDKRATRHLDQATREHVRLGGLLLRKIVGARRD